MDQNTSVDAEAKQTTQTEVQQGVVGSWWHRVMGATESTSRSTFGRARNTRAQVRRRVDATLTFTEDKGTGTIASLRKMVDHADHRLGQILDRGEAAVALRLRKAGVKDVGTSATAAPPTASSSNQADGARADAAE